MKTQAEIQKFLDKPDFTIDDLDMSQSYKSNLLIIKNNFKNLISSYNNLTSFVKNLYQTIDINNIINSVLSNLQQNKINLSVSVNLNVGTSIIQNSYKIERINDKQITITNKINNNWNTENIMVCVKDFDGYIVYPTVITQDNIIHIIFEDNISTNYKIIML